MHTLKFYHDSVKLHPFTRENYVFSQKQKKRVHCKTQETPAP